jgi:hypothetical protein
MSVQPGSKKWKTLVGRCLNANSTSYFTIGDAAIEIAPGLKSGRPWSDSAKGDHELLLLFAKEIDVSYTTLLSCRITCLYWKPAEREYTVPFSVYKILAYASNGNRGIDGRSLITDFMTVADAESAIGYFRKSRKDDVHAHAPRANPNSRDSIGIIASQWNDVLYPRLIRNMGIERAKTLNECMDALLVEVSENLLRSGVA